jgi:hypothetical protein
MQQELLAHALHSPADVMLAAAEHLAEAGNGEAAALLFHKAGHPGAAMELAAAHSLPGVLESVAEQLDATVDPGVVTR